MINKLKIWMDGGLVEWSEAKIHVLTHALHYGTSVFEGIRSYSTSAGPAVFKMNEHIERFYFSAKSLDMDIKFSPDTLKAGIKDCITVNNLNNCYIRPIAYFGQGNLGLIPEPDSVGVTIACRPWVLKEGADRGVSVKISKYMRPHPSSLHIEAKVGGHYVNSVLASKEARRNGFDEALLLDHKGLVAEGPGENIFMVKDGILLTPARGSILPGITRETIMVLAQDAGIQVAEREIRPEELEKADELFFVGTAVEVWPILKIDNALVGDGKIGQVTARLMADYKTLVRGENKKYLKYLTLLGQRYDHK
ncbi:MAG: branched-chain amino acid transaminase [Candidatus Taylorbacteria bacterium]|nr:branched-chain amino acid transaminase [Candidatus Taylorbacteria bacterium]